MPPNLKKLYKKEKKTDKTLESASTELSHVSLKPKSCERDKNKLKFFELQRWELEAKAKARETKHFDALETMARAVDMHFQF